MLLDQQLIIAFDNAASQYFFNYHWYSENNIESTFITHDMQIPFHTHRIKRKREANTTTPTSVIGEPLQRRRSRSWDITAYHQPISFHCQ